MDEGLVLKLKEAIQERKTLHNYWNILQIDKKLLAKAGFESTINREYSMGTAAYDAGISVPRIYGCIDPEVGLLTPSHNEPLFYWYLVMDKVEGKVVYRVHSEKKRQRIQELYLEEAKKIAELGIIPIDSTTGSNLIFNPKTEQLTFIDFECWQEVSMRDAKRWYEKTKKRRTIFY